MKPLSWMATGFVAVVLSLGANGWDLAPDALGWVLVLTGTLLLPPTVGLRRVLLLLGALALVVATATWPPAVAGRVSGADPGLVWALSLPALGYVVVLAHALAGAAGRAEDPGAATWWSGVRTVTAVVAVLPALVIGGGLDGLRIVAGVATVLVPVAVVTLLLRHASRPWVAAPARVE